jgi:cell division protein FtsQ
MNVKKIIRIVRGMRWPVILGCALAVFAVTAFVWLADEYLFVREMNFYGNRHLSEDDLKTLVGCHEKCGLFSVSAGDINKRLKKSPWIKESFVRKELTGRLEVYVTEAVAIAVLMPGDKPRLIDREGSGLEEIKQEQTYFLPVIKTDPDLYPDAYQEAVALAGILYDRKLMAKSGNTEITGARPEDITFKADDLVVKIGAGEFLKKLDKLHFVKEELVRRNMQVEYVDIRFADKIIVKPHKVAEKEPDKHDRASSVKEKKAQRRHDNKGNGGRIKRHVG